MINHIIPLLNFQKTFWEAERAGFLDHTTLHSEILFRCKGSISRDRAMSIATHLCRKHEILNSRIKSADGLLFFEICEGTKGVEIIEFRLNGRITDMDITRTARAAFRTKFDLVTRAPIRFIIINIGDDEYIFGAIVHHVVYDSVTLEILSDNIKKMLNFGINIDDLAEDVSLTFSQYTELTRSSQNASYLKFWQKRIEGKSFKDNFGNLYTKNPSIISRTVEIHLKNISRLSPLFANGYTLNILFMSAVIFALQRISGNKSMMIEAVSSDRRIEETRGTVGCLLDIFPIVIDIPNGASFIKLTDLVRREFLTCFSRRPGYYLEELKSIGYTMGQCPQINWAYRPRSTNVDDLKQPGLSKRFKFDSLDGEIITSSDSQISIPLALFAEADEARIIMRLISVWLSERTVEEFVENVEFFFDRIFHDPDEICFDE